MSSSNFLKKLRNRITRSKKSYDIETPGSGGHGTVLLRRYDRVPSMYGGESSNTNIGEQHPNILRNFAPPATAPSPTRYHGGDLTLPRHFRFRSGHHRTQSNITVTDHQQDDIDLYNAIGDHRRSSCSCACANSARKQIPFVPPINNTVHMTLTGTNTTRNAAKDPLPPIIRNEKRHQEKKEQEQGRYGREEESPRYIGIDDYSNVDFEGGQGSRVVAAEPMGEFGDGDGDGEDTLKANNSHREHSSSHREHSSSHREHSSSHREHSSSHRENSTTHREHSSSHREQSTSHREHSSSHREHSSSHREHSTSHREQSTSHREQSNSQREHSSQIIQSGILCDDESGEDLDGVGVVGGSRIEPIPRDEEEEPREWRENDLPVPHLSCRGGGERVRREESTGETTPPLSQSAPTSSTIHQHMSSNLEDTPTTSQTRVYPHNSGYHEYKEAHQVLRATSAGKMVNLHDIEVSSSVEDLYAHVPKGTAKTPDTEDALSSCPSDGNTDNEEDNPPPPIPSRNYRTDTCCSSPLSPCTHLKDSETGEELISEATPTSSGSPASAGVIHTQPGHEPIHMTLEEVLEEAKARGIPLEKPAAMTLHHHPRKHHKRASSTSHISPTHSSSSPAPAVTLPPKPRRSKHRSKSFHEPDDSKSPKGKFKLKNIFRKSDHDPGLSPPTFAKLRPLGDLGGGAGIDGGGVHSEDSHDPLNTSGEASMSEKSESVGNNSHCSSTDSGMEDLPQAAIAANEPTRTINADFIESLRKLKDCGWYWGPLSWDGAEARLDKKPDGSFLVRDSSDDRYILSISFRSQGTTHHTRIEHYKGTFSFFSQPKSHGAGTIIEFIEKAMEHSRSGKFLYFLRPRAPGYPPAPVQLLYPVSRFRIMQSLQHMCRFEILRATRYDHIDKLPLPQKVKDYLRESQYYAEYILDQGGEFMPL